MSEEERGVSSKDNAIRREAKMIETKGSNTTESKQKLQLALHDKAKGFPNYRFYSLYDKICRLDILYAAYKDCKENKGGSGIDGKSFKDIEEYGTLRWLEELAEELREKRYKPEAVKRVYIPKKNGKLRPLGIPTIKDRVVQTSVMLILTPIFEADLPEEQYAYRAGRTAQEANQQVEKLIRTGYREVIDADLSGYFDTIPHPELMKSLRRRISDGAILKLIKMWLTTAIIERNKQGRWQRTTPNKDAKRGTPQGAPISPLLSNIYMRRFVLGWTQKYRDWFAAEIVNYADDFVICCKGNAEEAMKAVRYIMEKIKLTINEEKTRICRIPGEHFDFLGYTFGRLYSQKTGLPYTGMKPSPKAVQKLCDEISAMTSRNYTYQAAEVMVKKINQKIMGWRNYFRIGTVSSSYRKVNSHCRERLRQWLGVKRKKAGKRIKHYSEEYLYNELGLLRLDYRTSDPYAKP